MNVFQTLLRLSKPDIFEQHATIVNCELKYKYLFINYL